MAKRFTETNKWMDPWFMGLSPAHKLAWGYLCDNCDAAGVIELNVGLANYQIGMEGDWDALVGLGGGRIERLPNGRLYLTKFIEYQYGTLSEVCPPHKTAVKLLRKHGLSKVLARYDIPSGKAQEKETEEDKERGSGGKQTKVKFVPPTPAEVQAYCDERKNGISGQKFCDHYLARGWKVKGGDPMKDWQAAVRTWEGNDFNRGSPAAPAKTPAERKAENLAYIRGMAKIKDDNAKADADAKARGINMGEALKKQISSQRPDYRTLATKEATT